MLQLEWRDAAMLGCGTGRGKHRVLPGMLFPSEREGAMGFRGDCRKSHHGGVRGQRVVWQRPSSSPKDTTLLRT